MILADEIKDNIKSHALDDIPKECCGLLLFDNQNKKIISKRCKNVASNPKETFSVSPVDYVKYAHVYQVLGVYHSHDDTSKFSLMDKANSHGHNIFFVVYNIKNNEFNEYLPDKYEKPYVGREFIMGKQDCLTLIIDYYEKELNITINNYFSYRNDNFFKEYKNILDSSEYLNLYNKENLIKILDGPVNNINILRLHDIIFSKTLNSKVPSHLAVYLGNGKVLHQPYNKFSCIDDLDDFWKQKIYYVLRHETLLNK